MSVLIMTVDVIPFMNSGHVFVEMIFSTKTRFTNFTCQEHGSALKHFYALTKLLVLPHKVALICRFMIMNRDVRFLIMT